MSRSYVGFLNKHLIPPPHRYWAMLQRAQRGELGIKSTILTSSSTRLHPSFLPDPARLTNWIRIVLREMTCFLTHPYLTWHNGQWDAACWANVYGVGPVLIGYNYNFQRLKGMSSWYLTVNLTFALRVIYGHHFGISLDTTSVAVQMPVHYMCTQACTHHLKALLVNNGQMAMFYLCIPSFIQHSFLYSINYSDFNSFKLLSK